MAQDVRSHPAGRREAAGGGLRRRLGEKQLLRLENLVRNWRQDRPSGDGRCRRGPALRRNGRSIQLLEFLEASNETVRRGIRSLGDLAAAVHLVDPGSDLVEAGEAQVD